VIHEIKEEDPFEYPNGENEEWGGQIRVYHNPRPQQPSTHMSVENEEDDLFEKDMGSAGVGDGGVGGA